RPILVLWERLKETQKEDWAALKFGTLNPRMDILWQQSQIREPTVASSLLHLPSNLCAWVETTHNKLIKLASGKVVRSIGTVFLECLFKGDIVGRFVFCHVVKNLLHSLSFGRLLLEGTSTLTTSKSRIIRAASKVTKRLFRLHLLGEGLGKIRGYLDGMATFGLPNKRSDIMAASLRLARRQSWEINSSPVSRAQVQFADGSAVFARGLVSGLDWGFGNNDTPVNCYFYVINNLPLDLILSCDFVLDLDLFFSKYKTFFEPPKPSHDDEDGALFCNIRLHKSFRGTVFNYPGRKPSSSATAPINDSSGDVVKRELDRRDQADVDISNLPEPEKTKRQVAEDELRVKWDW
ncbi:uncharacterized protein PgNI_08499, partial [Pyricularia grisea]|uniref:Uncharacterized protein n=1 Tax=Pyricularia grisea TaxID=148305 RepID=A0A6P8AVK2_PYRGI